MTIHTFGDSHSKCGWGSEIKQHWLGPILCYSFGKENLKRCNISNYDIKNNDSIIFCFGEIDCRCHINKYITNDKSYEIIIDEIVNNYIEAIKINLKNIKVKLKNISIYNVVPPVEKYNCTENLTYPYLGSDKERKKYVLYFNKRLKEECLKNNWIFFDVYKCYCDKNGYLSKKLSDSNVHIKDGRFIKKFINDNLL